MRTRRIIELILALGMLTSVVSVARGADGAGVTAGCDRPDAATAELHEG